MKVSPALDPLIGTRLTPQQSYINKFVVELRQSCVQSTSTAGKSLLESHNSMALYTLQMLNFTSGHRAVSDPFHDLHCFDLTTKTVLIEDKVVSSSHTTRLAWMAPLSIFQLENYLSHLRCLARLLISANPTLANQIWATTDLKLPHPIPLFFFLQERDRSLECLRIQPSTLKSMMGSQWELPLNTNRHLLSTWLHNNGCPSELIDSQLGHFEAGCYPFSGRSPLSPRTIGTTLIPLLQSYLVEQGWELVKGIEAPRRYPIIQPSATSKGLKLPTLFGPRERTASREAVWRKDAETVVSLIEAAIPADLSQPIPDEVVNALQSKLLNEYSDDGRLLIRLSLFRRHLLGLRRKGFKVEIPGRLALISKEHACFTSNSSKEAAQVLRGRAQFIAYLSSRISETPNEERRLAEILVSACIFGGQTSPQFIEALAKGFSNCISREKGRLYVDIAARPTAPVRRWFPDNVSWPLVVGYSRIACADSRSLSAEKINNYLIEILDFINVPYPRTQPSKRTPRILLGQLAKLARSHWRFRLPGSVRAYAEGEYACASVPLSNWVRLVSGGLGTLRPPSHTANSVPHIDDIQPIRKPAQAAIDYKQAKQFWANIARYLGRSSDLKSGDATVRSNARKKFIETRISTCLKNCGEDIPSIVQMVAAWIIHLCRNGTSSTTDVRASTVAKYALTIGEKLNALAFDLDFLSQSDIAVEEVYRNVLATVSCENRSYVAGRLKEFHSFLVASYAMPTLDWSEVVDDDLLEADAVDAGIVSLHEYNKALEIILSDDSCPKRDQLLRAAILFFAYRFGLRAGEIFRLAISDIIMLNGEMVIYVRNSIYGETKSSNGVRQLPLIGSLCDAEHELIHQWLAHIETFADGDHLASLFSDIASKRCVANRSTCVSAVVEALRRATGDPETRLRHLRHTCATRLYLAMFFDAVPLGFVGRLYESLWGDISPQSIRSILIGDPSVSRRGLYAMAMYMGHASPDVTHRHYVHLADVLLKEWIDREQISIDDKALAYSYQTSYANIRKFRSRHGEESSLLFLSEHFTRKSNIPVPELQTIVEQNVFADITSRSHAGLKPSDIDRLLAIATMRDSIDGLADRFLTSEERVVSVLLSASDVQEKTGYDAFAIPVANQDDFWVFSKGSRQETLDKESRRVRSFLGRIDQTNLLADDLSDAARIWEDSFYPHSNCLLINKRSDLERLLVCLKSVGIPAEDFEAQIPDEQIDRDHARWESIESWIGSLGLSVRRKGRLTPGTLRLNADNRVGLILRASTSHELGYQQTLNRALFVTAVWLSAFKYGNND